MKSPAISVIIPAYNEEKLIANCLSSLNSQNFKFSYEIILVNNGSTDNTILVAQKYHPRIVFEKKKGIIRTKQSGYLAARGKIIAFIDADSIAPPNWLSVIYQSLHRQRFLAVTGPYTIIDGPKYQKIWVKIVNKIIIFAYQTFGVNLYLAGGNSAYRKTILDRVGCFDTDKYAGEDEFGILSKIKKYGPVLYNPKMKIMTSGRRAGKNFGQFLSQLLLSYWGNFFSQKFIGRNIFPIYKDIR